MQFCRLQQAVLKTRHRERLVLGQHQKANPKSFFTVLSELRVGTDRGIGQTPAGQQTRHDGKQHFAVRYPKIGAASLKLRVSRFVNFRVA